jgi:hypothetical protein
MRNEMKGPNNIDSLLSNLGSNEPKNIQIDKDSTISVDDLDTLSVGSGRKKSKRKSDKNIIQVAI